MRDARGQSSSLELPSGSTRSFSCPPQNHLRMMGMVQNGTNDLHSITWTQLFLELPNLGTARESLRPGLNLARATSRFNNF